MTKCKWDRLMHRTHTRIRSVMKDRQHPPPVEMLGCTYSQLAKHLNCEGGIPEGYEIDHIIPLWRYDFDDDVDVMRAFNWQNTRLMERREHFLKGNADLPDCATLREMRSIWPHTWDAVEILLLLQESHWNFPTQYQSAKWGSGSCITDHSTNAIGQATQ